MRFGSLFGAVQRQRGAILLAAALLLAVLPVLGMPAPAAVSEVPYEAEDSAGLPGGLIATFLALKPMTPAWSPALRNGARHPIRDRLRGRSRGRRFLHDMTGSGWKASAVVLASTFLALIAARGPRRASSIQVLEILRSHFGEKRFADGISAPAVFALMSGFMMTAAQRAPSFFSFFRPAAPHGAAWGAGTLPLAGIHSHLPGGGTCC